MFYRLIHNAAPLPISRLFANRARILLHRKPLPVNRFRSRQPTITPADAANSRNHPKVAKSLTFVPARVQEWQNHTVFGIVLPPRKQDKPFARSRYRAVPYAGAAIEWTNRLIVEIDSHR